MTSKSEKTVSIDEVIQQLQAGSSMPAELLEIFAEEADDHLRTIYDGLNGLKVENGDMSALSDVRRAAHTLKGAAGAVNLQAATRLSHRMEDLLDLLADRNQRISDRQLTLLLTTADQLQGLTTGDFDAKAVAQQIVELYQAYSIEMSESEETANCQTSNFQEENTKAKSKKKDSEFSESGPSADQAESPPRDPVATVKQPVTVKTPEVASGATQYLRVPLNRLDDLVGLLGEMMVNRSQLQKRLDDFESRIEDMQNALQRLRIVAQHVENQQSNQAKQYRTKLVKDRHYGDFSSSSREPGDQPNHREEFDPLEFEQFTDFSLLAQTLSEADNDARIMSGEFRTVKTAFDVLLRRQQQLNRDAQKSMMRIRMVPLAGIVSRLERTVRTVSNKLGRQVELVVVGQRIELDKTVLDEIVDPLLHLIRNAIDHGVEDAETRAAAGKPETARLSINAANLGTQVTLRVSDDGAGINLEKVREKAVQQGLIDSRQELSNDELHALIFRPGFSTAANLSDVSGRGVGMDVVSEAIRRLKGTIRVESESGRGTTFTIQLPTTLGVTRAVLVESVGKTFAIPMQSIQKIHRLDPQAVTGDSDQLRIGVGNQELRLIDLAAHLQLAPEKQSSFEHAPPLLMLDDGEAQVGVTVDTILGSQDIVVKSLGNHLKNIRGIIGATIGGDGSVVPILDPTDLVDQNANELTLATEYRNQSSMVWRNTAMVVDDSISVRRVTENLLRSTGWEVVTAKDGVDALEKLAELDTAPDVFLCDMEMPRMDGIELIRQIREQSEFDLTPIVMVTSRASEKHRHRAYEAGATEYVAKPFDHEKLLELISRLVQAARETVTA